MAKSQFIFQTDAAGPQTGTNGHHVEGTLVVDALGNPFTHTQVPEEGSIRRWAKLSPIWDVDAQVTWLVEDLLPLGSVNLICSESGTGKTWVAYAIAGAVAHGLPFLGCAVQQKPVLYIDGENPAAIVKRNVTALGIQRTDALDIWGGWNSDSPPGPDHSLVRRFAEQEKGLLIWDSLVEFHPGDEQSSTETRTFMKQFRRLAHLGATVLILHHTGKSKSSKWYRGSSDIKAAVDTAYTLETIARKLGGIHLLKLANFKSRFAPGKNFGMEFQSQTGFRALEVPTQAQPPSAAGVIARILSQTPNLNGKQIIEQARGLGVTKSAAEQCLRDGPWQKEQGKGSTILYSLPAAPQPEATVEEVEIPLEEVAA
jgi:hypothetical protein